MPERLLNKRELQEQIRYWLKEDLGPLGDISSSATIPQGHRSKGIIHAKQDGILAGIPVAREVFAVVNTELQFTAQKHDGDVLKKGDIIAIIEGDTRSVLEGERLALNQLQRLSGIATKTRAYADAIEGLPAKLADTRKTTPGHRMLEKYAVRVGGGSNHRYGLFDAVMIKDNHIKGSGGIREAIRSAREIIPHTMKIEVETETLVQVREAVEAGADIIMLDNMALDTMREAVAYIRSSARPALIEASGGVSLETIRNIAETGVDIVSVGGLTSSVSTIDISLDLNEKKAVSR
ncbi:carboxylating nicotinate-nucleotide diphosphorylase [Paenibacillus turpanensis]|uniref:carboxylating nicotinate-nucleotide diphosphorylase n=1 Tax=Paenibacillus turpanensis TaxID=2689078 RepID=UPI003C798444